MTKQVINKIAKKLLNNNSLTVKEFTQLGDELYKNADDKTKEALRQHAVRGGNGFLMVNKNSNLYNDTFIDDYASNNKFNGVDERKVAANYPDKFGPADGIKDIVSEYYHNPNNLNASEVELPKDTYITRVNGAYSGDSSIKPDHGYSAQVIDENTYKHATNYGDDPDMYYLPKGTKVLHPGGVADGNNEVVVKGEVLNKAQKTKLSKYAKAAALGAGSFLTAEGAMANKKAVLKSVLENVLPSTTSKRKLLYKDHMSLEELRGIDKTLVERASSGDKKARLALRQHIVRGQAGYANIDKASSLKNAYEIDKIIESVSKGEIEISDLLEHVGSYSHNPKELAGSKITLEKPMYVVREPGALSGSVKHKPDSTYSARIIDEKHYPLLKDGYNDKEQDIMLLDKGDEFYSTGGQADPAEILLTGKTINKAQKTKLSKYAKAAALGAGSFLTAEGAMANKKAVLKPIFEKYIAENTGKRVNKTHLRKYLEQNNVDEANARYLLQAIPEHVPVDQNTIYLEQGNISKRIRDKMLGTDNETIFAHKRRQAGFYEHTNNIDETPVVPDKFMDELRKESPHNSTKLGNQVYGEAYDNLDIANNDKVINQHLSKTNFIAPKDLYVSRFSDEKYMFGEADDNFLSVQLVTEPQHKIGYGGGSVNGVPQANADTFVIPKGTTMYDALSDDGELLIKAGDLRNSQRIKGKINKTEVYPSLAKVLLGLGLLAKTHSALADDKEFIEQAKRTGYADEQIQEYLEKKNTSIQQNASEQLQEVNPNTEEVLPDDTFIHKAKEAGYTDEQINEHLASKQMPSNDIKIDESDSNLNITNAAEPTFKSSENVEKQDAIDLASAYSNIHSRWSTLGKMVIGATLDEEQMSSAMEDIQTLNNGLVEKLREKGVNAFIDPDNGLLMMQDEEGQIHEIEPGIFDGILASKFETTGAIGGAIAGAKYGASVGASIMATVGQAGPQIAVPEEIVTVPAGAIVGGTLGAIGGGFTGAFTGAGIDYLVNSYKLKDELDAKIALSKMTDAGVADAAMTILAGGVWKLAKPIGARTVKIMGHAFNTLKNGNQKGAYEILLKDQNITEQQVADIVDKWKSIGDTNSLKSTNLFKVEKDLSDKELAIKVISETQPGAEFYLKSADGSQLPILHSIDERAKNLHHSISNITDKSLGKKLRSALQDYQIEVGKFYEGVKNLAGKVIDRTDYRFNIDRLAVKPAMQEARKHIDDPFQVEKFKNVMARIDNIADSRTFSDLLDLRQTVNQIKAKATKKVAQDSLKKSIMAIDREIQRATTEYLPKEQAKVWRQQFKLAKQEYAKMKHLEKNYLYKIVTRKNDKAPVTEQFIANALTKSGIGLNEAHSELASVVGKHLRIKIDNATVNVLVDKHTFGTEGALQAIDFPELARELTNYSFKTKEAKQVVKEINALAEVFKNDKNLGLKLSNKVSANNVPSGIGDNLWSRFKVQSATRIYRLISQVFPTRDADKLSLIKILDNMMDNPLKAKNIHKFKARWPKEYHEQVNTLVKDMQTTWAQAGLNTVEGKEALKLYKATKQKAVTKTNGGFGPGYYLRESLQNPHETRNVLRHDIEPSQLATLKEISEIVGREVSSSDIRKLKSLPGKLKKAGFKGVRDNGRVMLFDAPTL